MTLFWLLAVGLVITSLLTVTARRPVYSVVYLIANFVLLAITYVTLSAEFLGVIQVIVYASAILMLFLFVMALLSTSTAPFSVGPDRLPGIVGPAVALVAVIFGLLVYGVTRTPLLIVPRAQPVSAAPGTANAFGSTSDFGAALMTTHLLPFEVTAFVLMVAVIGVVMLASDAAPQATRHHARRRGPRTREPITRERPALEKGSVR
ncbi:MAG: NADH-quinone oxidoreductase subunit J [Candidatus Eremiobacteraeota bacterium]|nr:NADH-quinone oxidoreductase subunit J [Candidatus Eremiobacteraeota bacterium]MBV9646724.1 NADH-quinone oxidoreductase subunit J [Candidatus Eremiobacteraeota bacterium]